MNVKKQVLLDAAQTALDTYAQKRKDYDAAAELFVKRANLKAATEALERQRALRDDLSAAVKAKKALTRDELEPKKYGIGPSSYGYLKDFAFAPTTEAPRTFKLDGESFQPPAAINREDLNALIAVLGAIEEDVISDGQLQRLGFKNVGWVLRAAVANGGEVK